MHLEDLHELRADAQRRVERRGRVLRHVADEAAADAAQRGGSMREARRVPSISTSPAGDLGAAALVVEQAVADRGLAGGGLADEAEHLAAGGCANETSSSMSTPDGSRTMRRSSTLRTMSLGVVAVSVRRSITPPPCRARCRSGRAPRPSAIRLVPMVRMPMSTTGTTTAHGWIVRPMRFSLIIRPQSAAGGCMPKPRKESAAMMPIE